jgi:hypothetical protein
MERALDLDCFT